MRRVSSYLAFPPLPRERGGHLASNLGVVELSVALERVFDTSRDRAALNAVAAQLRCPYLLLEAGSNGTEIVALIRQMSLVIAMRLHTLIFASCVGAKLAAVSYDPKVTGFMRYIGQKHCTAFETLTPEGLRGEIDAALAAQERYDVSHLHALAEENEQIARKLMEEA